MQIIGLDIGGTKCAVSRLTSTGEAEELSRFPTLDCRATLERFKNELEELRPASSSVYGISCGGPLDTRRGMILSPPNLPGWDLIPICDYVTRHFGGRAVLMNDANACALAEWQFGAGRGTKNMVFLTSGTGMGAGLILNGRLYEGTTGEAGEVGHMRLAPGGPVGFGKAGSFEGFCSGGGIARLAVLRLAKLECKPDWALPAGELTARMVADAAKDGDRLAREIMRESGAKLGQALAVLIDLLNPERIVIGGFYPACRELLEPAMQEVLAEEALESSLEACRIVPAELGEKIGSYGAIAAALSTQP
jgi:glucokinase